MFWAYEWLPEGKFIQKEGASHEFFLSMAMIPFQYEQMVVHKKILKDKEWSSFPY